MSDLVSSTSERVLLPENVKPINYNLVLTPDLVNFVFKGEVEIDLVVTELLTRKISMHCRDIKINKATFHSNDKVMVNNY